MHCDVYVQSDAQLYLFVNVYSPFDLLRDAFARSLHAKDKNSNIKEIKISGQTKTKRQMGLRLFALNPSKYATLYSKYLEKKQFLSPKMMIDIKIHLLEEYNAISSQQNINEATKSKIQILEVYDWIVNWNKNAFWPQSTWIESIKKTDEYIAYMKKKEETQKKQNLEE